MATTTDSLLRVKFASRRKRLTDGRLWYAIEYVDLTMAFRYFGAVGSSLSPNQLYDALMKAISGEAMAEPIRLNRGTQCQIGWRIFVHDHKDAVYLKLLGDTVFDQ